MDMFGILSFLKEVRLFEEFFHFCAYPFAVSRLHHALMKKVDLNYILYSRPYFLKHMYVILRLIHFLWRYAPAE